MLKQHLTHLILEMIGEDKDPYDQPFDCHEAGHNEALQSIREKVPELVEKVIEHIKWEFLSNIEYRSRTYSNSYADDAGKFLTKANTEIINELLKDE